MNIEDDPILQAIDHARGLAKDTNLWKFKDGYNDLQDAVNKALSIAYETRKSHLLYEDTVCRKMTVVIYVQEKLAGLAQLFGWRVDFRES